MLDYTRLHSQKRHRLDASCEFYRPEAICQQVVSSLLTASSSCICEHQTYCSLIFADLLKVDETTCIKPACSSQLAVRLLTTCNRLVIIKLEQATRTHPDIDLVIGDLLQLARFWLCILPELHCCSQLYLNRLFSLRRSGGTELTHFLDSVSEETKVYSFNPTIFCFEVFTTEKD